MKETLAELQARKQTLERKEADLKGKSDDTSKEALRAARAELAEIDARIEAREAKDQLEAMQAREKARTEADADAAVQRMLDDGRIPQRDTELRASWKSKFTADPGLIQLVAPVTAGALQAAGKAKRDGTTVDLSLAGGEDVDAYAPIHGGWDVRQALTTYFKLVASNARMKIFKGMDGRQKEDAFKDKGALALRAANFYNRELKPNIDAWEHIPSTDMGKLVGLIGGKRDRSGALQAGDVTSGTTDGQSGNAIDALNTLGVLSGTLVLQRTLPMFKYKYPELMMLYTDFSDTPGLFMQTEATRIVSQMPIEKYDATKDSAGRPKGWSTVSPAVTTDASLTLSDYVGVPIVFGQEALGSTVRRLFDEQSVLAIAAIADYFTAMLTKLFTAANYNSYATASAAGANPNLVPIAYPTYPCTLQTFSMSDLDALDAAFTSNKVPEDGRGVFVNPQFFVKLRGDMRLILQYAMAGGKTIDGASEFITEARLPKLSGFAPIKAPYLPSIATGTGTLCGFAFQKAAAILKSRLPQDFTQALGVMIPGSVTTVTDPDTKISVALVQYVHLTQGYAEWRPEVMLGASVGDKRAGICMTQTPTA